MERSGREEGESGGQWKEKKREKNIVGEDVVCERGKKRESERRAFCWGRRGVNKERGEVK